MRARRHRLPGQLRARPDGRRRRRARPRQGHRRRTRCAPSRHAERDDRRARRSSPISASSRGGNVVRNQLFVRCAGPGAKLSLNGASLLNGRQHADTSPCFDHAVAGCTSRELFKSVLDGASQGVFQGKIIVRPGAQKTDARMMTRALLLSEEAEADNKPELEIFADDVQCGHGATSRRARRQSQILPDGARHPGKGGRDAADPVVRRRGDRDRCRTRAARCAHGGDAAMAGGATDEQAHAPGSDQRQLRRCAACARISRFLP